VVSIGVAEDESPEMVAKDAAIPVDRVHQSLLVARRLAHSRLARPGCAQGRVLVVPQLAAVVDVDHGLAPAGV